MINYIQEVKFIYRVLLLVGASSLIYVTATISNSFTSGPVLCTFRMITNKPCPFCGTTRAVGSFFQGNFLSSWSFNPIGFVLPIIVFLMVLNPSLSRTIMLKIKSGILAIHLKNRILLISLFLTIIWGINVTRWY